jgi:hypothetical protein
MFRKTHTLAAAAALMLAGVALAADDTKRGVPGIDVDVNADANIKMPMVDKNSDGKVTRSEAASNADLSRQFDKLDANKDGALDKGEFAKFQAKGSAKAGKNDGAPGIDEGAGDEKANQNNTPGTTNDSTPGNKDLPGPGR